MLVHLVLCINLIYSKPRDGVMLNINLSPIAYSIRSLHKPFKSFVHLNEHTNVDVKPR